MNTKKWLRWGGLAVLAALISATGARAQATPPIPQGESADQRADLQLTAEQKAKMQEIHKNTQEQIKAVHNDQSLTAEQKREKVREIYRKQDQQAKGALSAEQFRRYQRRAHDRREDVRDRREDRRDRKHDGGVRGEREDVRDRREDRRDRKHGTRPPRPPRS